MLSSPNLTKLLESETDISKKKKKSCNVNRADGSQKQSQTRFTGCLKVAVRESDQSLTEVRT